MSQRKELLLERLMLIAKEPGITRNRLYIETSPACQRTGRRRSSGTYRWTVPGTLRKQNLVEMRQVGTRKYAGRIIPQMGLFLTVQGAQKIHDLRG